MKFIKLPDNALAKVEKPNYARPTFDAATSAFHTEKHAEIPDAGYNALEKLLNMPSSELLNKFHNRIEGYGFGGEGISRPLAQYSKTIDNADIIMSRKTLLNGIKKS